MNIQTVTHKDISLINVTNPAQLEIKYLKNNYDFDQLHLDDYINKLQTPKIEIFKNYTLFVLDFPYFNLNGISKEQKTGKPLIDSLFTLPKNTFNSVPLSPFTSAEKKKRILTSQVDFFIGKNYLVVLHDGNLSPINNIFEHCQKTLQNRDEYMSDGPVFLAYRIIDTLIDSCFPVLNELSSTIDRIDKDLDNPKAKGTLETISVTRRNIVVFHTMIKPILPIFRQIEEGRYKELNGSMHPLWANILDHLLKIWDRLEDNRELLEGISVSHESFLTARTNEIVKVLTIFSTIVLPLTLLASIYGMNIRLPEADKNSAFFEIILLMVFTAIGMLLVFKQKRWF